MNKLAIKSLFMSPLLFASMASSAFAGDATLDQVRAYADQGQSQEIGQVTSVSQLRDVKPTDWSFQALQSLVERYGCIAGYPDGSFRGNRAMTRYEFAAGLNSCLDRVNELIAGATADMVVKEDLGVLQRLQEEFQAELATLRGRVDVLEGKLAKLDANQFSTTTKLAGETIFDVGSLISGENATGSSAKDQATLGARVRLSLNTSFTGKDLLRTRLQVNNIQSYSTRYGAGGFPGSKLEYDSGAAGSNDLSLNELWYRFPVGKGKVWVGTHGLNQDKVVPLAGSLVPGSYAMLEQFRYQDAYRSPDGAGAAVSYPLGKIATLTGGYFAPTGVASTAATDSGLTGGAHSTLAQLTLTPTPKLTVAATYTHGYSTGAAGSDSGLTAGTLGAKDPVGNKAANTDNYGIAAGYKVSPKLNLSGWVGWSKVDAINSGEGADLFTWAVNLGLPDLFKKGNYGGVSVGVLPYISNGKGTVADQDQPLATQAFYSFKVSDNISIQPGIIYITNPNGGDKNDDVWLGSMKTTFRF
jgi:hypothetical protein